MHRNLTLWMKKRRHAGCQRKESLQEAWAPPQKSPLQMPKMPLIPASPHGGWGWGGELDPLRSMPACSCI